MPNDLIETDIALLVMLPMPLMLPGTVKQNARAHNVAHQRRGKVARILRFAKCVTL
jgi:hypothetical protein